MLKTDILIVGSGCSGLYTALKLPSDKKILIITKSDAESCDSFLAQGGICVLKDISDYDSYFEDTLRAGHYENDRKSVDIMIRSSRKVIQNLIDCGVQFHRDASGHLDFTREGAHSHKRILFHEDETGKEITKHLLATVRSRSNITLKEYTTMMDLVEENNTCYGAVIKKENGDLDMVQADYTILATGGIGGLYEHSTNYRHLTGDGVAMAIRHGLRLKDINYVQIHPTTFYTTNPEDRSFLISESVRGEGAKLYDKNMQRFTNELLPRDLLTIEIKKQMKKDGTRHVWEDLRTIPYEERHAHFPNIIEHCLEMGYDPDKEPIPVVPAQHYYMGGVWVNHESKTSMNQLYAVGETACNGVHGKNRLASNSLLESMVFAGRAADDLMSSYAQVKHDPEVFSRVDLSQYKDESALKELYADLVKKEIDKADREMRIREADAEESAADGIHPQAHAQAGKQDAHNGARA